MVLSGCTLSNTTFNTNRTDVQPSFVWLGDEIYRYNGASDVKETYVRAYQTCSSKACLSEELLLTQAKGTATVGAAITYGTVIGTELTYWKWVENNTRTI